MKKVKTVIDVFTLLVLLAGLVYCIYGVIDYLRIGSNFAYVMLEFLNLIPFILIAAIFFGLGRLIPVLFGKHSSEKVNFYNERIINIRKAFDFLSILIAVSGVLFGIWSFIAHSVNCTGCSAHNAHPLIEALFLIPFVLLAGVVFGVSRLTIALIKKNINRGK